MVSCLNEAVDFCEALHTAVPRLEELLAGSASDVQEAIQLLKMMHFFGIETADDSLRRMIELIFSPDVHIRDAVADVFTELHLSHVRIVSPTMSVATFK